MNTRTQIIITLIIVLGAAGAVAVLSRGGSAEPQTDAGMQGHDHSAMSASSDESQPVTLDSEAARRIGVTFATVTRGTLPRTVRTVGSVTYDETRLTAVSPKIEAAVHNIGFALLMLLVLMVTYRDIVNFGDRIKQAFGG